MLVDSCGVTGFVVYVMSNGQPTNVAIDGCGKMILSVIHEKDHARSQEDSRVAKSQSDSTKRKIDIRPDAKV